MIHWILINIFTREIVGNGTSDSLETYNSLSPDSGFEYIQFTGGVNGQYYVNNAMQEGAPA